MTFINEVAVASGQPRNQSVGETKMTSIVVSDTQHTQETIVATATGKDE